MPPVLVACVLVMCAVAGAAVMPLGYDTDGTAAGLGPSNLHQMKWHIDQMKS
jgi:hypothetical protein